MGSQNNRLCRTPPAVSEASGPDDDIGERNVLRVTAIANLNRNAAIAVRNDAVVNDNVFEITGALGADLERGGGRGQRTAGEFCMVIPVKAI